MDHFGGIKISRSQGLVPTHTVFLADDLDSWSLMTLRPSQCVDLQPGDFETNLLIVLSAKFSTLSADKL
jgi:hypothetical protein